MDEDAVERARERLAERREASAVDAALERARSGLEELAATAAALETSLPDRVEAVLREQVVPVGRNLAELRGLANGTIRRLERLEADLLAERHARVDDLALLVDLIATGWQSVDERLARVERALDERPPARLYRLDERAADASA